MDKFWQVNKELPNKENQEVINDFLLKLKSENRSERTIVCYRGFLERFFGDQKTSFSLLSSEDIFKWVQDNMGEFKESTQRFGLSVLSSFFAFCVEEKYVERSPIKRRWFPRLPKPTPKYLVKAEVAKIRIQTEKDLLRDQVLVEFLLASGCRVGEAHGLNLEDVDLENRTARVIGKGKKIRHVHFSEKCGILMERYLETLPAKIGPFFVTITGTRLGIRRIQKIFNRIGKKAELTRSLYPHQFRHTFATELLSKGADLSFISEELGHSLLGTTQIYASLPKTKIVSLYRKYMG